MLKKIPVSFVFAIALVVAPFASVSANTNQTLSCAGYSVDIKSSSVGLIAAANLKVSQPQVVAMDTDESCAVIVWNTSKLSTSQIVFNEGTPEGVMDILDSSEKEFWGYDHGSAQNNAPQAYHVMIISGLEEGKAYYARAVSRPHPTALPFASEEIHFTFEQARVVGDTNDGAEVTDGSFTSGTMHVSTQQGTNTASNNSNNGYGSYYNQLTLANSINRAIAPAHSSGKFFDSKEGGPAVSQTQNVETDAAEVSDEDSMVDVVGNKDVSDDVEDQDNLATSTDTKKSWWQRLKEFFIMRLFGSQSTEVDGNENESADTQTEDEMTEQQDTDKQEETAQTGDASDEPKSSVALVIKPVYPDGSGPGSDNDANGGVLNVVSSGVEKGMNGLAQSSIGAAQKAQGVLMGMAWLALLLPVVIILALLYVAQKFLANHYEWIQDKALGFWMTAFAVLSAVFMLLGFVPLSLAFLAFFLISLAWHLFNVAVSDMDVMNLVDDIDVKRVDNAQ